MLLMVTNRRFVNGRYGDEEKPNNKFDYRYGYDRKPAGRGDFEQVGKIGFEAAMLTELKRLRAEEGINTPKVGIYIHGYNNDYQDSIDELIDLEKNLIRVAGYPPVLIGFSWPSTGRTSRYLSDREQARDSVGAFTRFLLDINDFVVKSEQDCFSTTFCIAHSMGNYLLRKGMEYMSDYLGTPRGRLLFSETLLLAPDLASKDIEFDGKGNYIAHFSRRVHVYYSRHDRALKASSIKRFGGARLGREGVENYDNLPRNVVVVDAEKYANSASCEGLVERNGRQVSVHSGYKYHPDILKDIAQVLSSVDRNLISGRETMILDHDPANHFRLI